MKGASLGPVSCNGREAALARLASRQHGVVATWQLLELGFTERQIVVRVRQGRLHRLHRGVFAVGHRAITLEGRWIAAVLATGPSAVLSHRDGASLWRVADFAGPDVEVTVPGLGGRSQPAIRVHRTRRLRPQERTVIRGIPVTTIERTMVDLAAVVSPRHLRDAYLEAHRRELIDAGTMRQVLEDSKGRRGLRSLRRIADELTPAFARTLSPLEVNFLDFCREQGLPEPQVNVRVAGFLVDAYWPDAGLVVELDSYRFHGDRAAFESDRAKIADLKLAGIDVIPVTYRRLAAEPAKVASVIRRGLADTPLALPRSHAPHASHARQVRRISYP